MLVFLQAKHNLTGFTNRTHFSTINQPNRCNYRTCDNANSICLCSCYFILLYYSAIQMYIYELKHFKEFPVLPSTFNIFIIPRLQYLFIYVEREENSGLSNHTHTLLTLQFFSYYMLSFFSSPFPPFFKLHFFTTEREKDQMYYIKTFMLKRYTTIHFFLLKNSSI